MEGIIRAFAQHQAVLVHHGVIAVDIGIGMCNLGNLSQWFCLLLSRVRIRLRPLRRHEAGIRVAFVLRQVVPGDGGRIHLSHSAGRMILRRHVYNARVAGE